MLTIYRRHLGTCENRDQGRDYRRCRCPLWVQGTLAGEKVRRSLDLTNWEAGQRLIREWEARGAIGGQVVKVEDAVDRFFDDMRARQLTEATLGKHTVLLKKQLLPWCEKKGYRFITQLGVNQVREFRETWKDAPLSGMKKLERLKAFFRFCEGSKWIERSPAEVIRSPKVPPSATLPFTDEEVDRIFMAVEKYPEKNSYGYDNRQRMKALLLLLLHSGLRIRDAVTLKREHLKDSRLFLRASKTGTPVHLPLPSEAVKELEAVKSRTPEYFFWSGGGDPKSAVADFQRAFRRLLKLAGVEGHFHMFRDTMATRLLNEGVSIEVVAAILGHSVRICEKHYSPWVRSRQETLDAAIKKTWTPANVVAFKAKGA